MNKIIHILLYKYIYKPIHHTQTPKISRTFTYVNDKINKRQKIRLTKQKWCVDLNLFQLNVFTIIKRVKLNYNSCQFVLLQFHIQSEI